MKVQNEELQTLINNTKGKIFSCIFIKKDGEKRKLIGRIAVKKGIKGIGHKFNPQEKGLRTVYDMQKREFRFINLGAIKQFKCGKLEYHE